MTNEQTQLTQADKRGLLEIINNLLLSDAFTKNDINGIVSICNNAIQRLLDEAENEKENNS